MSLGEINFLDDVDNDNILLDASVFGTDYKKDKSGKYFGKHQSQKIHDMFRSSCSNKKIPVGILAETIHAVFSEFDTVVLIKMQLVGLWQKAVMEFAQSD
ncbi:hypothetical protein G9A89_006080 [Geosiphon pyriformis]|nr:hypothetical protein G9A89_006080 [Geosiphon pyriformis]